MKRREEQRRRRRWGERKRNFFEEFAFLDDTSGTKKAQRSMVTA